MWSAHRVWTYIVLCAVLWNSVLPLPAQAATSNVVQPHNTRFQSLYRADIRVATPYARAQLTKAQIPIISSQSTTAIVLVDMLQIAWLAADGYEPTHLLSIESMGGVATPLVAQPRTVTTARALALHALTTASPLRSWATTMTPALTQSIVTATVTDSDNDGLSDDEEAIWCLNPNKASTNNTGVLDGLQVQRVRDWMANRRETNSGSIPYLASSVNVGDCVDTDGDGVPNAVEILLGLNPNRASSDFDKYNDAQELFGRTVGTNIDMPNYVKNPGRHPMVAAFPKPVITISDNSIHVDVVTTITANGSAVNTKNRTYNSTHDTTLETQRTDDAVWAHWMQVDTTNRVRSARTAGVDEWTVYQKDTQTSDGGSGEENQLNWGDIVDCVNMGFYDSNTDCTQLFVTYPDEPTNDSGDLCQFDASGCGNDPQWDTYVTQSDSYTAPTDTAPDDIGVGNTTTCTSGFAGNCAPDAFITTQDNIYDTGTTSDERPVEQSGDVVEQPGGGTTIAVTDVQPVENAQPDVPATQADASAGEATSTDTTVEVVTFDEQAIADPGQIITLQSLENVTAINTAHAADLTFSYKIRNDGTDMMNELKNIKFNVYLNDDEYPITTYAVGNDKGSFANYKPGDVSATLTIGANEKIPLTLDQLKAIEVDPKCVAEVRQGVRSASTPCPGGRVRITVADMSYGADQLFYDNAVASGVMLGIDDGNSDGSVGIDWYVLPTWELAQSDTIANVITRYFPTTQDANGVLTGIKIPKFGTTTPPKGCNNSSVVGSGTNAVLWCPFDLSRTQWMEVLTNGVAVSQDIATAPASAGAKVILRLQRDSDGDGYSDDTELEYGTNPNSASQRPAPHLAAGVATRVVNGVTQGTLSIENSGNYPAHGIKATIFSPTTSNTVRNNQVGGSGEIGANSQLIIGSESQINQAASDWTGTAQLVIAGYYTGVRDVRYTLTAVCSDTCAIGSGDTTMTWSDGNGGSGTLAVGAGYASPTDIAIGDDGLTVGFQTGSVVNGETLIIDATAPPDTFQWVNNGSDDSKPIVVVEYGDATGAHRFALPAQAYLTAATDPLTTLHGAMLRAPTIDMVSHDFTADVGGQISLLLDNPLPTTIQSSQVLLRIMDADGKTQWQQGRSMSDIATGPMVVEAMSWVTSDFVDAYDASQTYTVMALWGDAQGNVIDRQARLLGDFQNDRMPELSMTLEGTTPTTVTRGSANIDINFGSVAQGYPMKRLFTLGNVGDVALRAVVDKIPFAQTSFAGSFFIPPGLTMPYILSLDSGQLPVGPYQQTVTLRTSDAQWPLLTVTLKATITASPVGGALAYIIDPYKPLTTGLYVQGPQTRKAVVKYNEAVAVDAAKVHPLVVRDDLSDQTLGLGRKIASNPSAYGYDPALVGLGMQGAMVTGPQGVAAPQDLLPIPQTPMRSRVCGGHLHGVAVKTDGTVAAWGNNDVGQATVPNGLTGVVAVNCIGDTSYAIKNNGTVVAWGGNQNGIRDIPAGLQNIVKIAGFKNWNQGYSYAIALKSDGTLVGWGDNTYGQLNIPTNLSDVVDLAGGFRHVVALKRDGTLVGWGTDNYVGNQTNLSPLLGINGVVAITAGYAHTMALKNDGTVIMWGNNDHGQMNVPAGLNNVKQIYTGMWYSFALKNDGSVVGWGYNEYGQLSITDVIGVVDIGGTPSTSFMVRSDGTVIGRGHNGLGEIPVGLNIGSLSGNPSPTPIPSRTPTASNNLGLSLDASDRASYPGTGNTWYDTSGNNKNFAMKNGMTFISGGQMTLDGVDDFAASALVTNRTSMVSMEAYFNTSNSNQADQMVFYNGTDANRNGYGFAVNNEWTSEGRLFVLYGGVVWVDVNTPIASNTWYHAVMVISDTTLKVYVNGELRYQGTHGNPNTPTFYTFIGRNDYPTARNFNGKIALARIYNKALTDAEVQTAFGSVTQYPTAQPTVTNTPSRTPLPSNTPTITRTDTLSSSATTPDINNGCYWREADGTRHRYEVKNSMPVNWTNALSNAQSMSLNGVNGYLATITTPAEMECVYQLWRNANPSTDAYAWLSGSDAGHEGSWIWQSGPEKDQAVTVTYWRGGEPNNDGGNSDRREDCNGFWSGSGFVWNSSWNDSPCSGQSVGSSPIGYIVEYSSAGTALDSGNSGVTPSFTPIPSRTPTSSRTLTATRVISGRTNIVNFAAGIDSFFMVKEDGNVISWGNGSAATLPDGLNNVKQIAVGIGNWDLATQGDYAVAVRKDGTVVQWGRVPTGFPTGLRDVVAVDANIEFAYALKSDGTLVGWGRNYSGVLSTPTNVGTVKSVCLGAGFTLALRTNGTLVGWGEYGRYGDLSGFTNIKEISCENDEWVGLKSDGTVVGQGLYWYGSPVPSGLSNIVQISSGGYTSMALRSDGTIISWGRNDSGEASPPVSILNSAVYIATASGCVSFGLHSDGRFMAWGGNSCGGGNSGGLNTPSGTFNYVTTSIGIITPSRTPLPSNTPTPSRTLTPSRTITPSPTLTPTPNDSFAVDKADTGPERERRILIPTAFAKSARYAIDNGLLYTYTAANSTQSATIRLPRSEYLTMTLELWPLTDMTGKIDVDVGGNGSIDWTVTNASPKRIASGNLAAAITAFMASKTTDTVDVPITIKSAKVGQLLLVNVAGVPKPQADLSAASISVAGARSIMTRGWSQVQVPRAATNRVSVTIKNDGKGVSAPSSAALAADLPGQGLWYIDSQPVPRLAAGASATVTFSWDTARWPNLTGQLKLIVDPYNVLPERAKGNNTRSLAFRIANGAIVPTDTPSPTFTKTLTPSKTATSTRTATITKSPTITKTFTLTKTNTPTVTLTVPPTMVAAPALRLRYRFDEADTATSYADSSGNNNSLACNATDATCPHTQQFAINNDMGGALYFSSSDATLARATAPVAFASAFSISTWVRLADVGHTQVLLSHGASANNKSVVLGVNAANQAFCTVGAVTVTSTTAFNFAAHLLTCVYDLNVGSLVLYYDRDIVASTYSVLPYLNNNTNTLSLGARWLGSTTATDYFDGWLDEVSIWNSALSSRDVEMLYNQPRDNGNRVATRTATVTITRTATPSPTKKK